MRHLRMGHTMIEALLLFVAICLWTWVVVDTVALLRRWHCRRALLRAYTQAIALTRPLDAEDGCPRCTQQHLGVEDCPTYRGLP